MILYAMLSGKWILFNAPRHACSVGTLPFDDESIGNLFTKIKEAKYFMPNFFSDEAKDLINRMLQPNPLRRITIKEIKQHPWYLKDLPHYLSNCGPLSQQIEID